MRMSYLSLLLLAPALPGCAMAAIGLTSGAVLMSTAVKNEHSSIVQGRTPVVWASVKATLAEMSNQPVEALEDQMQATATIDNHKVVVIVKSFDLEQSQVSVDALQFGMPSSAMASEVLGRIVGDVSER